MSRCMDTSTEAQMAKIMVQYERSSRSSRKESVRSPCGRTIMGKAIWESSIWTRLVKSSELGMFIRSPVKGLFLSVNVDDVKLAGKTENIEPTWKILMEDVDLGEPTSFLDHGYLWCTPREWQIGNEIVQTTEICSNPGFLLDPKMQKQMERHAKKCEENLQKKKKRNR